MNKFKRKHFEWNKKEHEGVEWSTDGILTELKLCDSIKLQEWETGAEAAPEAKTEL